MFIMAQPPQRNDAAAIRMMMAGTRHGARRRMVRDSIVLSPSVIER
jgi:hypothetical protein